MFAFLVILHIHTPVASPTTVVIYCVESKKGPTLFLASCTLFADCSGVRFLSKVFGVIRMNFSFHVPPNSQATTILARAVREKAEYLPLPPLGLATTDQIFRPFPTLLVVLSVLYASHTEGESCETMARLQS